MKENKENYFEHAKTKKPVNFNQNGSKNQQNGKNAKEDKKPDRSLSQNNAKKKTINLKQDLNQSKR